MEKRILLIADSVSFIVNAIMDALKKNNFLCDAVTPNVGALSKINNKPPMFFLYVDEATVDNNAVLVFLRDLCIEEDKRLFLMGYPNELEKIIELIPKEVIGGVFERPINAKEIADRMIRTVDDEQIEVKKKHILVVDDSGTMLRTIKSWLEPKYQVSIVNSAANALSFLGIKQPDLILLDYEMPVCSGPQMLQMLRSETRTESIPVIFLTSKGDRESVREVLSLSPQGYLLKTMAFDQIIESIDKYFATEKSKKLN